ncbi:uncharacterized protein H6S33_006314 [Morchella sextelata]|uniref:uncharacterized protein n=1 Tax=Morchella sextelata TaxID=1174677 RepID=UPI001D03B58D|nr:uncharacterized protein H6S33_006314 [Morchella sextelata]KAH0604646.1 hypothetical protein H6S33_006314 [Morchella sextelata]
MYSTLIPKSWPWYDLVFSFVSPQNIHQLYYVHTPPTPLIETLPNEILLLITRWLYMEDIVNIICAAPGIGPAYSLALTISTETDPDLPETFIATKNGLRYWHQIIRYKGGEARWWSPKTPVGVVSSETLQGIRTLKRACGMKNVAVMRVLGVVKWVVLSEPIFALLDSKEVVGSRRPSPKSNGVGVGQYGDEGVV